MLPFNYALKQKAGNFPAHGAHSLWPQPHSQECEDEQQILASIGLPQTEQLLSVRPQFSHSHSL